MKNTFVLFLFDKEFEQTETNKSILNYIEKLLASFHSNLYRIQ